MKKLIEMIIDNEDLAGVFAVSLVSSPAIKENFILLSEDKNKILLNLELAAVEVDRQVVTGPALIPDQEIVRYDENGDEYYIYFSEKTIQKISENFLIKNNKDNVTLEHNGNRVPDIYLIESWIVNDPKNDKANSLGFDVAKGTLMLSYLIKDKTIWDNYLKDKSILKGFSIEGRFGERVQMSEEELDEFLNIQLNELYLAAKYTPADLKEKYIWKLGAGDDQCPSCLGFNNKIKTLQEWTKIAIPATQNGTQLAGVTCSFPHSPYPTFCEEHCKCKLVKIVNTNKKEVVSEKIKENIINPFAKWKK